MVGVYQPLFSATADPETLLDAIEWEIYYLPEYYYWDGFTDTNAGCVGGGTVSFTATDAGDEFSFDQCGISEEVVLSGNGFHDWENDVFTMDVTIGDCPYTYERSGEEYTVHSGC